MSLLYYSRMRFIDRLVPLLLLSGIPFGARVISIYAAGAERKGQLYRADLSLNQPKHYSFANCRTNVTAMKTMNFESLADQYHGKLSLTHVFPGLVVHSGFENPKFSIWFKVAWTLIKPFSGFFSVSHEEIGQRILYFCTPRFPAKGVDALHDPKKDDVQIAVATTGVQGGGAYSATYTGETNDTQRYYEFLRADKFRDTVLQHTKEVFSAIEKDGIFLQPIWAWQSGQRSTRTLSHLARSKRDVLCITRAAYPALISRNERIALASERQVIYPR